MYFTLQREWCDIHNCRNPSRYLNTQKKVRFILLNRLYVFNFMWFFLLINIKRVMILYFEDPHDDRIEFPQPVLKPKKIPFKFVYSIHIRLI